MINFFRNIRRKLANENKFQRYMRYAIGEVILIMLGIFMALQLQNWNEKRKQDAQFKVILEQIYNSIKYDNDLLKIQINDYTDQIIIIDSLLQTANTFEDKKLPYALFFISHLGSEYSSELSYYANNLTYNPDNQIQNEISKQITSYIKISNSKMSNIIYNNVFQKIEAAGIPSIKNITNEFFAPTVIMNLYNLNESTYSQDEINRAKQLLSSEIFRADLSSLKTNLNWAKSENIKLLGNGISIMVMIKNHHPEVKLLFQNVGVKGTAIDGFDNVYGKSTPMRLINVEKNIWELDIYLLKGKIKFRCRDSWAQNWGADDFPTGIGFQEGPDIIVPVAGNYHIIFKPETGEYEFIKQDD